MSFVYKLRFSNIPSRLLFVVVVFCCHGAFSYGDSLFQLILQVQSLTQVWDVVRPVIGGPNRS